MNLDETDDGVTIELTDDEDIFGYRYPLKGLKLTLYESTAKELQQKIQERSDSDE